MRLYGKLLPVEQVCPTDAAKFEDDAGRYWDLFYKRNADKFFRDRHYFDKEWPQLTQGKLTVLEVGCGVGNTVFPLLELNQQLQVYACDFSPRAVALVKAHPAYEATGRVAAFVADITQAEGPGALLQQLPGPCVDYCSMVFVLSAVAPHKMRQALRNVSSVLKPGSGRVLFRDYAEGDLAQTRLQDSTGVKHIRGNFYARGDGTCCYYFTQDELSALFASEGFVCESSLIHARTIENRKSGVQMPRRWVQAVFRYSPNEQQQPQQQQVEQQQQQNVAVHHPGLSDSTPAQCRSAGATTGSNITADAGVVSAQLAGHCWLLPCQLVEGCHLAASIRTGSSCGGGGQSCCHAGSSCSGGRWCPLCLAAGFSRLAEQQELQLLGRCVLLLPPWLCLRSKQQQQQQGCDVQDGGAAVCREAAALQGNQQHDSSLPAFSHLEPHQEQGSLSVVTCTAWPDLCSPAAAAAADIAQQQGVAAALLALLAVWLGARRVYVCLPGGGGGGSTAAPGGADHVLQASHAGVQLCTGSGNSNSSSRAFAAAFSAVLGLNESSVVVERVRPRWWLQGSKRQAQLVQREVVSMLQAIPPGCAGGLVVVGQQGSATSASCGREDAFGSQQFVDAVQQAADHLWSGRGDAVQLLLH